MKGERRMNWISRLERKFGRFAIPNLMYFIIILYGIGFVLNYVNPYFTFSICLWMRPEYCMERSGELSLF